MKPSNDGVGSTFPILLPHPSIPRIIKAFGFEYSGGGFEWVKLNEDESLWTGQGYNTRANIELCLLATRGSPPRLNADVHSVVMARRLEHSEKPEEVAKRIERLGPGPYLELFARRERPGWDCWGNEIGAAS